MRTNIADYRVGAMGALLDEYEKALGEIIALIDGLSQENYERIMDAKTEDPDCRSIQTIMYHVINAGYGYSFYIRQRNGEGVSRILVPVDEVGQVKTEAKKMFDYAVSTSESLAIDLSSGKDWEGFLFRSPWGEIYNLEQILEHAVVHVLRHRRQVEKFLLLQSS